MHLYRLVLNQEIIALNICYLQFDGALTCRQCSGICPDVFAEYPLASVLDVLIVLIDDVVNSVYPIGVTHEQACRFNIIPAEGTLDIEGELHRSVGQYVIGIPVQFRPFSQFCPLSL